VNKERLDKIKSLLSKDRDKIEALVLKSFTDIYANPHKLRKK